MTEPEAVKMKITLEFDGNDTKRIVNVLEAFYAGNPKGLEDFLGELNKALKHDKQ